MKLHYEIQIIECSGVSSLTWDGDDLVEPMTGRRIVLGKPIPKPSFFTGYPFDRSLCLQGDGVFWTLVYDNRGTKAVLYKNWKEHRELNRSYYFAKHFDYPIALARIDKARVVIVHCPNSYDTIVIEDAETGEVLGENKSTHMEFQSRLSVSENGALFLSAGWFWHPLGGAWVCPVRAITETGEQSEAGIGFSFGAEIDAAAFLGNDHVVVTSTSEVINHDVPQSGLGPLQLGVWSITESKWVSTVPLREAAGTIMPWKDWVISFYKHPKAIEIATGRVVHVWDQFNSGTQIGSIDLGNSAPPVMALNPQKGLFAISDSDRIYVVSLHVDA